MTCSVVYSLHPFLAALCTRFSFHVYISGVFQGLFLETSLLTCSMDTECVILCFIVLPCFIMHWTNGVFTGFLLLPLNVLICAVRSYHKYIDAWFLVKFVIFCSWKAMLSQYWLWTCVCMSLVSRAVVVFKGMHWSRSYLAQWLPSSYYTPCFKEIRVSVKMTNLSKFVRDFRLGKILPWTCDGPWQVLSTIDYDGHQFVALTVHHWVHCDGHETARACQSSPSVVNNRPTTVTCLLHLAPSFLYSAQWCSVWQPSLVWIVVWREFCA